MVLPCFFYWSTLKLFERASRYQALEKRKAAVSHDHGQTWDLDHRYLLHTWVGNRKGSNQNLPGPQAWWASSQATSTVLLPDGNLLTAFGTGYRSQPNAQGLSSPRDVGLIEWRLNEKSVSSERQIQDAAPDSDLRNWLDPGTGAPTHAPVKDVDPYMAFHLKGEGHTQHKHQGMHIGHCIIGSAKTAA